MSGIIIAIFLGWAGGYRFYKKQLKLGILYLLTMGLFGIGWIVDIIQAVSQNKKPSPKQTTVNKTLRTYIIKQSELQQGFEKLQVSSNYDPIQEGIKTLRVPNPNNKKDPYIIDIGDSDIVFKEMDYHTVNGLESFQFYAKNHHIGTIFDSEDTLNRKYIQAMIKGKVDAVHVEFKPKKVITNTQLDYEINYDTKLWMHIKE